MALEIGVAYENHFGSWDYTATMIDSYTKEVRYDEEDHIRDETGDMDSELFMGKRTIWVISVYPKTAYSVEVPEQASTVAFTDAEGNAQSVRCERATRSRARGRSKIDMELHLPDGMSYT